MADKHISALPAITRLDDDSLFVAEQQSSAGKVTGAQIKGFARDAVTDEVAQAHAAAEEAEAAKTAAAESAQEAKTAREGIDQYVTQAQEAATKAEGSADQASGSAAEAETASKAAAAAQANVDAAKAAAIAAQEAAEAAKDTAWGYATTASQGASTATQMAQTATNAANQAGTQATKVQTAATDAAASKTAAQTAQTGAEASRQAIENMVVDAITLATGDPASVSKTTVGGIVKLVFGLPRGATGLTGTGIARIALTSGNHAPGSMDTYTVRMTDGTSYTIQVYNGQDGQGSGDMTASVYDTQGRKVDIYDYVDDAIAAIPVPDVSGQIDTHNTSETAHAGIRKAVTDAVATAKEYTDSQIPDVAGQIDTHNQDSGAHSNIVIPYTAATARANIYSGLTLHNILGRIQKWFADMGTLAFKSSVSKSDLEADVQASIGKADTAVQTETDPTVPAWAKADTKPTYTASEVGADASGAAAAVSVALASHAGDSDIHVTAEEKAAWNSGSGGGTSAALPWCAYFVIPVSRWTATGATDPAATASVGVTGIPGSGNYLITPTPVPTSWAEAARCGVYCTGNGDGGLEFGAAEIPGSDLTYRVLVQEVEVR